MNKTTVFILALAVLAVMNLISFFLMAHDKRCAKQGRWRVPEKTLFLATALFGGLGDVLGMQLLHHKTRHWYFKVFLLALLILQIAALAVSAYFLFR